MSFNLVGLPWLAAAPEDFNDRRRRAEAVDDAATGTRLQALAGYALDGNKLWRLGQLAKRLDGAGRDLRALTRFRLGLLSNATVDLLTDAVIASGLRHGLLIDVHHGPFGQALAQAMDEQSAVNGAQLDAILVALDHRDFRLTPGGEPDFSLLDGIVAGVRRHGGAPLILQSVAGIPASLFGSYDALWEGSWRRQIARCNQGIQERAAAAGHYVLDVAALAEAVGTVQWHNPRDWHASRLPFAAAMIPLFTEHLARLVGAIRGRTRKCLVLDLDNTLWGGVIGDDGLDGIVLEQGNAIGEAHLAIQQVALWLRERGILLAVCSRNEEATARLPFREHPAMLLREEHIAAFVAQWDDKPSGLRHIAELLNIGTDALVLLDDNPAERAAVRAAMPEVAVPEWTADPNDAPGLMLAGGYFEAVSFSEEDRHRAALYQASTVQRARGEASEDMGSFLRSLQMVMRAKGVDVGNRARVTQLTNKTNQFNLTTRRYTETQIAAMEAQPDMMLRAYRLADRDGDHGLIAVVFCRRDIEIWDIETWLMSCRVLGRRVEEAVLADIAAAAAASGAVALKGSFIPSGRNEMVREHYRKLGFALHEVTAEATHWTLALPWTAPRDLPIAIETE